MSNNKNKKRKEVDEDTDRITWTTDLEDKLIVQYKIQNGNAGNTGSEKALKRYLYFYYLYETFTACT